MAPSSCQCNLDICFNWANHLWHRHVSSFVRKVSHLFLSSILERDGCFRRWSQYVNRDNMTTKSTIISPVNLNIDPARKLITLAWMIQNQRLFVGGKFASTATSNAYLHLIFAAKGIGRKECSCLIFHPCYRQT